MRKGLLIALLATMAAAGVSVGLAHAGGYAGGVSTVSVLTAGAKCDGVTDDSAAIQAALNSTVSVLIPPGAGTCVIGTAGLTIPQFHSLIGSGAETSILSYSGTGCAIKLDSVEGARLDSFRLNVLGSSATKAGLCFLNTTGNNLRNEVRNVQVWGDPANARTVGTYGVYVHSTTSNSLYYNAFDHVSTAFWDVGFENIGDAATGGAQGNFFYAVTSNANSTGIRFQGIASDNQVDSIYCNAGGAAVSQTCLVIGDGSTTIGGNRVFLVSDQGAPGKSFTLNLASVANKITSVNESTAAGTDATSPSTNEVTELKPGGTNAWSFGNLSFSPGSFKVAAPSSGAGSSLTVSGAIGAANSAGGDLVLNSGGGGAGTASPGNVTLSPGARAGSTNGGSVTVGQISGQGVSGVRIRSSRVVLASKPFAAVDCAAANLAPTVSSVLDGSYFTCATAQTLTLPTAQGSSGIVQGLPGTPAAGDIFELVLVSTAAANFTLVAGTGGTIVGNAATNNATKIWRCRVTSVTSSAETYSCY